MACSGLSYPFYPSDSLPSVDPNLDASVWLEDARNQFDAVANLASAISTLHYTFPVDAVSTPTGYTAPSLPDARDYTYTTPAPPSSTAVTLPSPFSKATQPTFTRTLEIDTSGQPGAAPTEDFGDAPAVTIPTFPATPTWTDPTEPTIDGITIPDFAPVATIDTSITVPTFTEPTPSGTLAYSETLWSSTDLADMQTHMDRIRNGDFAIGAVIWGQIYDRSLIVLQRQAISRERKGRRAWAANGWDMPGGIALAEQRAAAQDINQSSAARALEIAVQEATQKDDQFWKSIQNGVQIEQLYETAYTQYYDRQLRAAIATVEAVVSIYNALVLAFNARVAGARLQIESKRLEIENERLKLEDHKLVIEAAIARGEADKLELELYKAQWDGIKAKVQVFGEEVRAIGEQVNAQKLRLEAHGLNIQQYATRVEAWSKEWDGYESKMRGEQAKATVFDSYVKEFTARVQSADSENRAEASRMNSETEVAKAQIQQLGYDIERFKAEWGGIGEKLRATASASQADASLYGAQVSGASAASDASIKVAQQELQVAALTQSGNIKSAELDVQQAIEQLKVLEGSAVSLGQIYAQLLAATYTTLTQSRSISNTSVRSASESVSCSDSTSYNYDCEC